MFTQYHVIIGAYGITKKNFFKCLKMDLTKLITYAVIRATFVVTTIRISNFSLVNNFVQTSKST